MTLKKKKAGNTSHPKSTRPVNSKKNNVKGGTKLRGEWSSYNGVGYAVMVIFLGKITYACKTILIFFIPL
jgi:CO dehydrogenase/acetyl-CoA synthase epsilon subunit